MSATLHLTRQAFGFELRRGTFHVMVDGNEVALIDWNQSVDRPLDAGHHTLRITAGRYSSEPRAFDAAEGDVVAFRCHGAMLWPRYVVSFLKPDLAISLRRE